MADRPASPLLPACKLWQKASRSGTVYYVGRLGGLRVLVLPNSRRETDGDHTHTMMFAEAPPTTRPIDTTASSPEQSPPPAPRSQPRTKRRSGPNAPKSHALARWYQRSPVTTDTALRGALLVIARHCPEIANTADLEFRIPTGGGHRRGEVVRLHRAGEPTVAMAVRTFD